uniref:Uncharacterized protein n=1 Tax=Lotharella oceanica TaxID=641309 RepID=A0A7S2XB33_9EUKA|mmetsp:Transcript_23055/g.43288  ORF Transcript_23055/g.43288 Transcript_23055/m.43288 type:complete len:146 (+) Transcript_23055:3-440(+)
MMVMMVLASAVASPLLYYMDIDLAYQTYRMCEWYPWWTLPEVYPRVSNYRRTADFMVTGVLILGTIGFAHWGYRQYLIHRHTADGWYRMLWLAASFGGARANFQSARLALGIGTFFTLYHLYNITKAKCTLAVQIWGEAILEVRE